MMKKMLSGMIVLALLCSLCLLPASSAFAETDPCGLRGWELENGYQYVIMGWYPYAKDPAITKKNANDPEMD